MGVSCATTAVLSITPLFTDRVSGKDNAIGRVRPSVRLFPLYLLNLPTFELKFYCVWVTTKARLGLKVKVKCERSRPTRSV